MLKIVGITVIFVLKYMVHVKFKKFTYIPIPNTFFCIYVYLLILHNHKLLIQWPE
jgi:hypothetical protein